MSAAADPLAGLGSPVGTPPPSSGDPLAGLGAPVGAATPPPAAQPAAPQDNSLWGKAKNFASAITEGTGDSDIDVPVGFVKSAAAGVGGLMHLVNQYVGNGASPSDVLEYKQANPHASDADALQAVERGFRGPTTQNAKAHMTEAADWLTKHGHENGIWQNLGGVGELAGELLSPLGIEDAPVEGGRVLSSAEKMAQQVRTAKFLESNPKIAKLAAIGARTIYGAVKAGTETGVQTYVHTGGDTDAATKAAEMGAATGGVLEGGLGALKEGVAKTAPAVENIAGEDVQTLSSQRPGTGPRGSVKPNEVPAVKEAQQAAAPRVFKNVAQRATHDALEEANQGRQISRITDPARLLPAPENAQPFQFTIPGTETTEGTTGELLQPAAKRQQAAFKPPSYVTSSAPETAAQPGDFSDIQTRKPFVSEGTTGADIATTTPREPAQDVVTGGGKLVTDPETAQAHLTRLNDILDNPHPEMTPEQLRAVTEARDNLSDQMGMYHAYQRTLPNFNPINSQLAADSVTDFGAARDQLQNAAQPIYQKLDDISDGEFGRINRERAAAGKRGDYNKQYQLEGQIRGIIDNSDGITHAERAQATRLWSKSMVLDGLHDAVEHAANVNEKYASQVAGGRVLSGVRLQNGLNRLIKQYGQDRIEGVIGKDGMENMTRMADLLNTPKGASGFKGMSMSVMHNLMHGKVGGALGAAIGHHFGNWEGAIAGSYAGAQAEQWLLRQAATNPHIGQLVDYAVRNNVTPKVAAGLISSAIIQDNQPPQDDNTQEKTQ